MTVFVFSRDMSVADVVLNLRPATMDMPPNIVNTTRDTALTDILQRINEDSFQEDRRINVKYQGEDGVDAGAVSDSLYSNCLKQLPQLPIFHSEDDGLHLVLNMQGMYDKLL